MAATASAQESTGRPGWTFVPSFAFSETYDDNVTLFGRSTAESANNDFITAYTPQADLMFNSRRTRLNGGYSGSLLDYQTFSIFNRWDQRAQVGLRRIETQRLSWDVQGNITMRPSTDVLDFDGIPFSHTGATALSGRGAVDFRISARDAITGSFNRQKVSFDRPDELRPYLRGGQATELSGAYRRRVHARLGIGTNYGLRRASAVGEPEDLTFHVIRGAFDYQLSPHWSMNAGAGLDLVMATPLSPGQRAPGFSIGADRTDGLRRFHIGYQRMFMPSFGFGGAIQSQELGVTYFTPIFSRRFYTEHIAALRDSHPLVPAPGRLQLRALRVNSALGWSPRPWVRIEGFYSRAIQTSLIPGGYINRNRFGFVIVTSRPVRMQ
jgi:hypothetical protein